MNLNIELPDALGDAVKAKALSQGVSADRYVTRILENTLGPIEQQEASLPGIDHGQSIWEMILDNMRDVPREAFESLPKDGASEVDHYLYGHPKRNQ